MSYNKQLTKLTFSGPYWGLLALGRLCTDLAGPHCHDLGPIFPSTAQPRSPGLSSLPPSRQWRRRRETLGTRLSTALALGTHRGSATVSEPLQFKPLTASVYRAIYRWIISSLLSRQQRSTTTIEVNSSSR